MTTRLDLAEWAWESGRAANRADSGELLSQVGPCGIDQCREAQRKEKAMDKTLADSFPASVPPAWQS